MSAPVEPTVVALIPARAGSKRIANKNVRPLRGHPLIAYTIAAARRSGLFAGVIVSTDSEEIAAIARRYGAEVPFLRPPEIAGELATDIEWLEHLLKRLATDGTRYDCFSLLRPTSPFRQPATIQRAWREFCGSRHEVDSLRAVELCKQHPGKMWVVEGARMRPLLDDGGRSVPWHSTPYQGLPPVYAQNASLEIAWSRVVLEEGTIAGRRLMPFFTTGFEGFDINRAEDWLLAEHYLGTGEAVLPEI
jgi:CMP-N,N'-diacetyllegionaminic acid synthase